MKFSGEIGFWRGDVETKPGVFTPTIDERHYTGDIIRNSRRFQSAENQQSDNLVITNQISIIADLYMRQRMESIRYAKWMGVYWKVKSVTVDYPKVTLELGEVYSGDKAEKESDQNGEIENGTP